MMELVIFFFCLCVLFCLSVLYFFLFLFFFLNKLEISFDCLELFDFEFLLLSIVFLWFVLCFFLSLFWWFWELVLDKFIMDFVILFGIFLGRFVEVKYFEMLLLMGNFWMKFLKFCFVIVVMFDVLFFLLFW